MKPVLAGHVRANRIDTETTKRLTAAVIETVEQQCVEIKKAIVMQVILIPGVKNDNQPQNLSLTQKTAMEIIPASKQEGRGSVRMTMIQKGLTARLQNTVLQIDPDEVLHVEMKLTTVLLVRSSHTVMWALWRMKVLLIKEIVMESIQP